MKRIELFKLFGFPIRVDLTWLFIVAFVTLSLAGGFFPANYPGLEPIDYWSMAFVAAMGLFASIIFHELAHSLVARHFNIPIDGITLFIFGGVAEMREEPASPKSEFLMAVVGPLASLFLAGILFGLFTWLSTLEANRSFLLIFYYLGMMNLMLALFNFIPAFPLDGGRVFRSILWAIKKDFTWATKVAAWIGRGFGWLLIGWGAFQGVRGGLFSGAWYILIGFFLQRASRASEEQIKIKAVLEHIPVTDLMQRKFIGLHPWDRLSDLAAILNQGQIYSHYPVLQDQHLIGFLRLYKLQELGNQDWENMCVSDVLDKDWQELVLAPAKTAWDAFAKMRLGKTSNLFITDEAQLSGVVTAQDLLKFVQEKLGAKP